jgi:hypothetical protein
MESILTVLSTVIVVDRWEFIFYYLMKDINFFLKLCYSQLCISTRSVQETQTNFMINIWLEINPSPELVVNPQAYKPHRLILKNSFEAVGYSLLPFLLAVLTIVITFEWRAENRIHRGTTASSRWNSYVLHPWDGSLFEKE